MKDILNGLQPEALFRNFESLARIPRESGNEKEVSDFLVDFAKKNGLEVIQDKSMNVIMKKPATKGYEKSKSIILQGHMDMVCIADEDYEIDFKKDPIPLVVDGDYIRTEGTTLGADNGIAVAMIMAIMESKDLLHPALTGLITVEEETGMGGVLALDPKDLSGDILINLDSEEEGIFLASCAGGVNNIVKLPIQWENAKKENVFHEISIKGLLGGHSGAEIDKKRASSLKLMGRLLKELEDMVGIDIASISGGEKMNAIPKTAKAVISFDSEKVKEVQSIIMKYEDYFKNEFKTTDPGIKVSLTKTKEVDKVFADKTKSGLISILMLTPFSVQSMSADVEGLVVSSNNIGVLSMDNDTLVFSNAVRSSIRSLKEELNARIEEICKLTGASMELVSDYPEWEFKVESPIRDLMVKTYKEMFKTDAKVSAIHAGLECGFLKEKTGDIDMISMGPEMHDVHTPSEKLSISSSRRLYEFLCELLKRAK